VVIIHGTGQAVKMGIHVMGTTACIDMREEEVVGHTAQFEFKTDAYFKNKKE